MPDESSNPILRWTMVATPIAMAVWLCYAGVLHGLAGVYGASSDPDKWESAAHIEPANAENWYRLGRYRQLDFDHTDIPLSISYYRRAVQLNPRSPFYQLDLASALEMSGDTAGADRYYREAQHNYPISAEVSWKYGNFLLRQQRLPEAYAEIRSGATVDPKLIPLAVSRAWHSNPDVHVLLDEVLPNTAEGDWEALSYLTDSQEAGAAVTVWNHLMVRKPTVDWKRVFAFTDMLVAQQRFDDAGSAWREATALDGISTSSSTGGSLVFDGGFERNLSGGGFGWRQEDIAGADFDFDTSEMHSGTRSVRIQFDGTENVGYQNLYQEVLVTPGVHYRFRGYLRTDQITSDSGIRFEILDPKDVKNLDVMTPNETGTQPWTLEEADFTPGPTTHLILVRVLRSPSHRFNGRISGTVWVDDVNIIPVASPK